MNYEKLTDIPGIGVSIAADLVRIGIKKPADLRGRSPEALYEKSNKVAGVKQDRCLLYVFRCAVYCVEAKEIEKGKDKWWKWKD